MMQVKQSVPLYRAVVGAGLALAALLLVSGCGFQPLYGQHSQRGNAAGSDTVVTALNQVRVASIPERGGQVLRNRLMDRLYQNGRPTAPLYELTVALAQTESGLGVRRDATTARTQLDATARYALTRQTDSAVVLSGLVRTSVSYNRLEAQYATLTAREDAQQRALYDVAEQLVSRLALHFGTTPEAPAAPPSVVPSAAVP
jgi:LPS-assembly lipoprotein